MSKSLAAIKFQSEVNEVQEKTKINRKRAAIVLIISFLLDCGYHQAAERLQYESGVSISKFQPADNIDLLHVLAEFEEFYRLRFDKLPKLYRIVQGPLAEVPPLCPQSFSQKPEKPRVVPPISSGRPRPPRSADSISTDVARPVAPRPPMTKNPQTNSSSTSNQKATCVHDTTSTNSSQKPEDFTVVGHKPVSSTRPQSARTSHRPPTDDTEAWHKEHVLSGPGGDKDWRLLRPLMSLSGFPSDLRELAEMIQRDIVVGDSGVKMSDVVALPEAKQLLKEAIAIPLKYHQLFVPPLRPWRGVLLFGPPGTGKTMLAKAVASECRTTFFNISASTIVSKWRGDSEKLVRVLFDLARYHAPSTIFIDELDSVMSARSSQGEHEGSRRMKTELLIQLDGLASELNQNGIGSPGHMGTGHVQRNDQSETEQSADQGARCRQVFLLAASNCPWDLDPAVLRRLEKRILIGLPDKTARKEMFKRLLKGRMAPDIDEDALDRIAESTEGYSGADINIVCREALMRKVREKVALLERAELNGCNHEELQRMSADLDPVSLTDLMATLETTKASSPDPQLLERYVKWEKQFGSGMSIAGSP